MKLINVSINNKMNQIRFPRPRFAPCKILKFILIKFNPISWFQIFTVDYCCTFYVQLYYVCKI